MSRFVFIFAITLMVVVALTNVEGNEHKNHQGQGEHHGQGQHAGGEHKHQGLLKKYDD